MAFKTYRDESRINYGTTDDKLSLEQVNTGCMLRIADAVEKMAGNYTQLQKDKDYYMNAYRERNATIEHLNKKIAGLRGTITKMKNKHKAP